MQSLSLALCVLLPCAIGFAHVEAPSEPAPVEPPSSETVVRGDLANDSYPRWSGSLENSAYAYNGENGAWEQTRVTLSYLENVFVPKLKVEVSDKLSFRVGAALLVPFDQEQKVADYYPYVQTRLNFEDAHFEMGTFDSNHDFPSPLLDPLISITPQVRVINSRRVPIDYETFPNNQRFTHGRFEYGASLKWYPDGSTGELYINWQLPDTSNHRERFDIGLTHRVEYGVPWYLGVHYWHNGGHENSHSVAITENYTAGLGLRNEDFSLLYLASYFLPNRDAGGNVFGQALYAEFHFAALGWIFQPQLFVSDELRVASHQYISIEGDPFFLVPAYIGLNLYRDFEFYKSAKLRLAFVNGLFQKERNGGKLSLGDVRYDQLIKLDFVYDFSI